MKLFQINKSARPRVVVVGCGPIGAALSGVLSENGFLTTVVDKNPGAFELLPVSYIGNTLCGDATDGKILKMAEIQSPSVALVMSASDNANILIAQMMRQAFQNDFRIIARLNDPKRAGIYELFDIEAFSAEGFFAKEICRRISALTAGEQI